MLSVKQRKEKIDRISMLVDIYISDNTIVSISDLSKKTGISTSTIQRDLNEVEYIQEIYGSEASEKLKIIKKKLEQSKRAGLSKGGQISVKKNEPLRNEDGKFVGNRRK